MKQIKHNPYPGNGPRRGGGQLFRDRGSDPYRWLEDDNSEATAGVGLLPRMP